MFINPCPILKVHQPAAAKTLELRATRGQHSNASHQHQALNLGLPTLFKESGGEFREKDTCFVLYIDFTLRLARSAIQLH